MSHKESLKEFRDAPTQSPTGREILNNLLGNNVLGQNDPEIPEHLDDNFDPMMPRVSRAM
jgi:hypothetical protein